MDIKTKLIEQLAVLENMQTSAIHGTQLQLALDISGVMLNYILAIDMLDEDDDCDYIREECVERAMEEGLINDIASASDLPVELVKRVLDGQSEVLGMDD